MVGHRERNKKKDVKIIIPKVLVEEIKEKPKKRKSLFKRKKSE